MAPKDSHTAEQWAKKAHTFILSEATKGECSFAQLVYGYWLDDGICSAQDKLEVVRYFQLSAAQGNADAQNRLGKRASAVSNEQEAMRFFKLAADQGHPASQNNLAVRFEDGLGETMQEAVRYYKLAADQGNVDAQYNLGWCYADGTGVTKNGLEGVRYFKLAAKQGHVDAQYNLGCCYAASKGVFKSEANAARYFKQAADQGDAEAQDQANFLWNKLASSDDEKYAPAPQAPTSKVSCDSAKLEEEKKNEKDEGACC